jgi:hypothetical protein
VSESQYGLNGPKHACVAGAAEKDSKEERHRRWLFDNLEGLSADDLARLDLERSKDVQQKHIEVLGWGSNKLTKHQEEDAELEKEKQMEKKIKMAYKDGPPDKHSKVGFMLPSEAKGVSTTRLSVKIRQGSVYHTVFRFKTVDQVCNELTGFDWNQLDDLDLDDAQDEDSLHAKYYCEMLLRLSGRFGPTDRCAACQQGLRLGVCTCKFERPPEGDELKPKLEDVPKSKGDVTICDFLKEKMEARFEVFAGGGRHLLKDRLFVRNELWKVMRDPALACILREVIVYVPATVLDGVELIDAPGTGTASPQEKMQLDGALRIADSVAVMMQRNLENKQDIETVLKDVLRFRNYDILKRMVNRQCPIFLFSAIDEKSSFSKLEDSEKLNDHKAQMKEVDHINLTYLKKVLKFTLTKMEDAEKAALMKGKTVDQILAACEPSLKARTFSSLPLLWASLALSLGVGDDIHPSIKKDRKDALCGMSKMLSALKGCARETQLASQMRNFSDVVKSYKPASQTQMKDDCTQTQVPRISFQNSLTEDMRKHAEQEARPGGKARRGESETMLSEMNRRFDTKVYTPLCTSYQDGFVDGFMEPTIEGMTPSTPSYEKKVINDVLAQMNRRGKWHTLRTAFSEELAGTHKTLNLFKSFFDGFNPPSEEELKEEIAKLRKDAAERVQNFMKEEIIDALKSSAGRASRGSALSEEVSDVVKAIVTKTVQEVSPIQSSGVSLIDESLSLFKKLAKTKRKSIKAMIHDAQVKSLKKNLLTEHGIEVNEGSKDRRSKDGKELEKLYKERVIKKAQQVIEGAKEIFKSEVLKSVDAMLQDFKSRCIDRRGKARRLPVLFRLRRACFKRLVDLNAAEDDSNSDTDVQVRLLVDEFERKWQELLDEIGSDTEKDAHVRFIESIYVRHMPAALAVDDSEIPYPCKARKMKVIKMSGEPQVVTSWQARKEIIAKIKANTSVIDSDTLRDCLANWTLKLGYSKPDGNSLFRTLDQILRNYRATEQEDDSGAASSGASDASSRERERERNSLNLRAAIVTMVLQKHQTEEELKVFHELYEEYLSQWAERMCNEGEYGDAVCIEYFARHFKVKIRLHTCSCKEPLQFPMFLELKQEQIPVDGETFYRIAHMHVEQDQAQDLGGASGTVPGGVLSANGHYVPIWPAPVRIAETPAGTPVRAERELDIGGESWSFDHVTGQEKKRGIKRNTQAVIGAEKEQTKKKQQTGFLSVVDDMTDAPGGEWQEGELQMICDRLVYVLFVLEQPDMSQEDWADLARCMTEGGFPQRSSEAVRQKGQFEQIHEKQLLQKHWARNFSVEKQQPYFVHRASNILVWAKDLQAVRNGRHKEICGQLEEEARRQRAGGAPGFICKKGFI